jgi:hypothetical protein
MSKGLQWVIGIGVVLVVGAVVFSSMAPFLLPRAAAGAPRFTVPNRIFGPRLPFVPGFPFRFGLFGRRMPFFSLFGLAGCIGPLLLAGLIVLAISALSRRPVSVPPQAPPPAAQPAAPPAVVSQAVCSNCGQPLQPGWRHCPNCGTAVGS